MEMKTEEFLKPVPPPLKSPMMKSSTQTSPHLNLVTVLQNSRRDATASDGFRLILASIKYITTNEKPVDVIPPVRLLEELSKVTSLLTGFNDLLIVELFKFKVLQLENVVLKHYLHLLVEIARSHTFYHHEVSRFVLQSLANIEEVDAPQDKLDLVHSSIQVMMDQLPHFPETFIKNVSKTLPFMTKSSQSQLHFYRNVLRIAEYAKESLTLEILSRVIHKIIDLDCHCPKEALLAAEKQQQDEQDIFFIEVTHSQISQENSMAHPLGNTFDLLMELLFEYIDRHTAVLEDSKTLYRELLTVFEKFIMSTYKCLHIQFLIFYLCSKRPIFVDHFVDFLWKKIGSPNSSAIFRQISAYYLGSFLCRAKFISMGTLKDSLELMCRFLHSYIAQTSSALPKTNDSNKHATFYSVCQTVFYTIAFLHKEIIESKDGLQFLQNLNLERIVTSTINPLRVIYPTVCLNFANVSRHYQLVYCHSIIEKNQRGALPMAVTEGQVQQLDIYFPFDPYILRRSKRWIDPIYRDYVDHLTQATGQQSDDEDSDAEAPEEMQFGSVISENEQIFSYSVSPGFIHS